MHRRLALTTLAVAAAGATAVPAAAQATAHVGFRSVGTRLEQRHSAVKTRHVLATICLRNTVAYGQAVDATVRSNFLLEDRYTRDQLWTPRFHWRAGATGERCERYWVIGVAADVERRLRFKAQPATGVTWTGPSKAGPGFHA